MIVCSPNNLDLIKVIISFMTLSFAVYQFIKTRRLKKRERRLLLYSKFFYLESIYSASIFRIEGLLENRNQIPELIAQELSIAHKLDCSVLDVISEISELSYGCFDKMDKKTAQNVQNFLGCASETYHFLNGIYGVLEKGSITHIKKHYKDITQMSFVMSDNFNCFRTEMYKHCKVKPHKYSGIKEVLSDDNNSFM